MKCLSLILVLIMNNYLVQAQNSNVECECNIIRQVKRTLEIFYSNNNMALLHSEYLIIEYNKENNVKILRYDNIMQEHISCLEEHFKLINIRCYTEKWNKSHYNGFYIRYSEESFKKKCLKDSDTTLRKANTSQ